MTTLLEFYLKYLDFLYLDPRYRITDSRTSGVATNGASLTLTSPLTSWQISNDRGQILFGVASTKFAGEPRNWFRLSIIRQYLDNYDETNTVSDAEAVAGPAITLVGSTSYFPTLQPSESCEALTALEDVNAEKYWGRPNA